MKIKQKDILGIKFNYLSKSKVSLSRITKESRIDLAIEDSPKRESNIKTGIKFFNHTLAGLASRACFNLNVKYKATDAEQLEHVVVEDVGLTLGRAVREMLDKRREDGVNERGSYTVAFDEALVAATLAFDGRSYTFFYGKVPGIKQRFVEDMLSTNLRQFFEGFVQGAGCVVQIQFWAGEDTHHTWEATFKAFGEALRDSLGPCKFRAGQTIGLKGTGKERKL